MSETPKLEKCPTGIDGLDHITRGGFPRGRTVLVCGGPGCGKTLLGLQFVVRGAERFGESGVIVSFEESRQALMQNALAVGCDLPQLVERGKIYLDCIDFPAEREVEAGEFDLDGLFVRLEAAIRAVPAQRFFIDGIETLFSRYSRTEIVRAELQRLNRWLREKRITALLTGESQGGALTRYGIEEFLSDGVIRLDHRSEEQIATRRLRVAKLRGSGHGTNEYPFTISDTGVSVLPITELGLEYPVSNERVSTGVTRLDTMLDGAGFFRGASVLVSGTSGTGKTSLAMAFVAAACARGERALYFAFEEAPSQIVRNAQSIGLDLTTHSASGLLRFEAQRATAVGLDTHLLRMIQCIVEFQPHVVVIDPVSNLTGAALDRDVKFALTRLVDHLKTKLITILCTDLTRERENVDTTSVELSSLMDTWILLRTIESQGERNRGLFVLKSRGMSHSNQIREFVIRSNGLDLVDVYTGTSGVLTGTARIALEARERFEHNARERKLAHLRSDLENTQRDFEAQRVKLEQERDHSLLAIREAIAEMEEDARESSSTLRRISEIRVPDPGSGGTDL